MVAHPAHRFAPKKCGATTMGMQDEPTFDTSGMSEIFFNDIRGLSVHDGIFRCTLYSYRIVSGFSEPCWVPVQPLAMSVGTAANSARKALAFVSEKSIANVRDFATDALARMAH